MANKFNIIFTLLFIVGCIFAYQYSQPDEDIPKPQKEILHYNPPVEVEKVVYRDKECPQDADIEHAKIGDCFQEDSFDDIYQVFAVNDKAVLGRLVKLGKIEDSTIGFEYKFSKSYYNDHLIVSCPKDGT